MEQDIAITFEGEYIKVITHGGGIDFARRVWSQVKQACNEDKCFSVLGIGNTTSLSTMEAYDHAALFRELELSHKYRIAWVETNADTRDIIAFTETVLYNRAFPGRLFSGVSEAKQWLLDYRDT